MQLQSTKLEGVKLIQPEVHHDERGFLKESFSRQRYQELLGISADFVQDNISASKRGVLRGLHYQKIKPQGKLIMVTEGVIFDVVADINPSSQTYGQYFSCELSAENHLQLWVPSGYAHGFCVLSEQAQVLYKCTDYYQPDDQGGVAWNCPTLAIDWPIEEPILSAKDALLPAL
ncbi:MAG: dTDP-4-dehydrorhamnose 3,5-epimerase [Alcaligenaceae bacterium]|jgi:dTDP-4-dehydrorhamnose 3,5-epimerase|nr:dTDP-4-dehydrorhamnose 3,5-epimerase [Alcaligenaceae bacterium]HZJ98253.1 dTDP-4-dehydrorhamnose 3,5-epimerase [Oligella sp.]